MNPMTPNTLRKQQKYYLNNLFIGKDIIRFSIIIKESSNLTFNREYCYIVDAPSAQATIKGSLDWHIWDWINNTRKVPSKVIKNYYPQKNLFLDSHCLHLINKNPILNLLAFTRELQRFLQLPPFNLASKITIKRSNSVMLVIE